MRFLVSRLSALGDVACGLPVATALKQGHPGCEVVWLCDRRFAGIPQICPDIDHVEVLEKDPKKWKSQMQALGEFEVGIDLQGLLKSALPVSYARCKQRVGYHWQREGSWLFTSAVKPDPSSIHVVDQYVDVARAVGGVSDRAVFNLVPNAEDVAYVRELLRDLGHEAGKPLVLANAGAGWGTKRWPPELYARLVRDLGDEVTFAFLGTEADRSAFNEVREASASPDSKGGGALRTESGGAGTPRDLLGKTNVRQLVALISLCDLHVAGDTGSTHIAAALGRPCIGLYTLTRPERCCPYGQYDRSVSIDYPSVLRLAQETLNLIPTPSAG